MDQDFKMPASPGTPLLQASPERVNQQRSSFMDSPSSGLKHAHSLSRDSMVHDKVAAFNSLAFQGKQLERKTNDAALKRAMLGREEAESEMRRYREDVKALKRQVEEGKERERRVGERLESVMENYGRAKETHAHTQTLWEKEIRRARKESFKSQSVMVKLQEELKSTRITLKSTQADLEVEKERSTNREQEAFTARYQLVGVQEELSQVYEKIKIVEQERDALRTVAKNEEVVRIAAEGRIPLPQSSHDDEFASPKKARKSMDLITRSAASEEELNDIKMLLEWEQRITKRAHDQIEFLEMECKLNCCKANVITSTHEQPEAKKVKIGPSTTLFSTTEPIFRAASPPPEESPWISPAKKTMPPPISTERTEIIESESFARTPSCEPPATAMVPDVNTSLLSLLDAPQSPDSVEEQYQTRPSSHRPEVPAEEVEEEEHEEAPIQTFHTISTTTRIPLANPPDLTLLPTSQDPALSPTMSREEALAQIRERRGRARSLAQGTLTPRKQMVEGGPSRRDISAPAIRSGNARGRSQVRPREA